MQTAQIQITSIVFITTLVVLFALACFVLLVVNYRKRYNHFSLEKQLLAAQALLQGQQEERTRLAKDLHDGLGGILSSTKYAFGNIRDKYVVAPEHAEAFDRGMEMLDKSIIELRRVAHNMMPEALVNFGLHTALQDYCGSINQTGALQLNYQAFDVDEAAIATATASTIYRIVQELVNNALKHAAARNVLVQLVRKGNTLSITVEDNGKGFDKDIFKTGHGGMGYQNLKDRIAYLNGTLDIETAPGNGTSVNIEVPDVTI